MTPVGLATWLVLAQTETQHGFDFVVPVRPKLDVTAHMRVRSRPGSLGFYQIRGGPIVSYDAHAKLSLIGGYYYAEQENTDRDFIGGHRMFGGFETPLAERPRWESDVRVLTERFLATATDDFSRHRFRWRLLGRGRVAPYTTHELFLDAQGFRSIRLQGGVRWRVTPVLQLDFGYFFEPRRANVGPDRHMFLTNIHLKRPSRKKAADPDP